MAVLRPRDVSPTEVRPDADLESLYRHAYQPMVRLAYLLTRSEETARDLVQDAFVRMHRQWTSIDQPVPYLRRTVVNACYSWHRRRVLEVRHRASLRVETSDLRADEMRDALERLPFRQRAAITLRFYEDLTEAQIAEALGCRPGTVGPLIHRGLEQLRRTVKP